MQAFQASIYKFMPDDDVEINKIAFVTTAACEQPNAIQMPDTHLEPSKQRFETAISVRLRGSNRSSVQHILRSVKSHTSCLSFFTPSKKS